MGEESFAENISPSQTSQAINHDSSTPGIFWILLLAFFILHLYRLDAPPNGYHQWRESDTAAIIQNYYQEDSNFLHPRINQRGATSGITGMELPVYNYSSFLLYLLLGSSHFIPRLLTLLGACLSLWLFFKIVASLIDKRAAVWSSWAMAFSPLFFFYSYKIMPDIWMLTFLLGAVFLFLLFCRDGSYAALIFSAICLCLSGCIKPLGLSVYLPFLFLFRSNEKRDRAAFISFPIYIMITLLVVWGWFQYARWINGQYGSPGFYLGEKFLDFHLVLFSSQFLKKLIFQWPFELWIGWVLLPAFLPGLYRCIKEKKARFYLIWILGSYLVFMITARHSATHDYYTLIIVPPLAVFSGIGLVSLLSTVGWRRYLAIMLLVMAPLGAILRVQSRFGPTEDFTPIREAAQNIIPARDLVMVQDNSTAIRLYQLNRHGWPLRSEIKYEEIKNCVGQGAKFLILDKTIETYNDSLTLLFDRNGSKMGPLYCYLLRN